MTATDATDAPTAPAPAPAPAPALSLGLSDVALLARVQRPVVSMWRSRSADGDTPFPAPLTAPGEDERFDVAQVVDWLELTRRGNNPTARQDAAAYVTLTSLSAGDEEGAFDGLTALLCLKVVSGEQLAGQSQAALLELADEADPDDELLVSELEHLGARIEPLAGHADSLADAAYHPAEAFERLLRARSRWNVAGRAAVTLSDAAQGLMVSLATALAADAGMEPAVYVDPTCGGSDLLVSLLLAHGDVDSPTVLTAAHAGKAARMARRRLRAHGILFQPLPVDEHGAFDVNGPAVHLAQYPSPGLLDLTDEEVLAAVDNIVLQMDDSQRAAVIAPASALTDSLGSTPADGLRDGILRSGRVRAVVRLPKGLLSAKPRQPLALWVLGPAYGLVELADRWTMTADLANVRLDAGIVDDLVTDLVAAMGDWATVRAHAFRFTRPVNTRSLLATRQGLVDRAGPPRRVDRRSGPELALRIGELVRSLSAAERAGPTVPVGPVVAPWEGAGALAMTTLGRALTEGWLRVVAGNRLDPADLAGGPVHVLGPEELTGARRRGSRGVDRLLFTQRYDAGRYTEPDDVVFCTSPRPAAWVDAEGASVVAFPARVLRIDRSHPGGLVPEVVAADINAMPPEAKAWRLWPVRRVPDGQRDALHRTLSDIDEERTAMQARGIRLDELARLLTEGVASGSLTLDPSPRRPVDHCPPDHRPPDHRPADHPTEGD